MTPSIDRGADWNPKHLTALRPSRDLRRNLLTHKRITRWVLDRVQRQIDIELRPVEMPCAGTLYLRECADRGVAKPRKLVKREMQLTIVYE